VSGDPVFFFDSQTAAACGLGKILILNTLEIMEVIGKDPVQRGIDVLDQIRPWR